MRMINDLEKYYNVAEVAALDATPAWNPANGSSDSNPEMFLIEIYEVQLGERLPLGQYKLNGSKEVYQAAIENFNKICLKAAKEGYFCFSDFENFDFY